MTQPDKLPVNNFEKKPVPPIKLVDAINGLRYGAMTGWTDFHAALALDVIETLVSIRGVTEEEGATVCTEHMRDKITNPAPYQEVPSWFGPKEDDNG